jgi:ComF family protein
MAGPLGSILGGLVAFGFPSNCIVCKTALEWPLDRPICEPCWRAIPFIAPPFCGRCGLPYEQSVAEGLCGACRAEGRRRFRRARAVGRYEGVLRETILALKFAGRTKLATGLGRLAFRRRILTGEIAPGEAVVPVPLHWRRRRERGFNQAELLARAIARAAERPCRRALVKVTPRPPQAGLSAAARRRNAAGAYRARLSPSLMGKPMLLVDDVFTTGATVEACARALLRAGAGSVDVLTVARVP